jgi:serine/alanine adding enzyme
MECKVITKNSYHNYEMKWANFIFQHPSGNIFQSHWYYKLFLNSPYAMPIVFLLNDENDDVKGVLVAVIQYQLSTPFRFLSSRSVIMGGPVVADNNEEYAGLILREYDRFIRGRAILSQFRNLSDISSLREPFTTSGYIFEEHLDIHVDLTREEDQLWKEVNAKRRNEIRKALKYGLSFKVLSSSSEFEKSYEILHSRYRSIRLPLYDKQVFEFAFNYLSESGECRIFGVFYDNLLIGTMYTFCFKGVVYNWFAGSDPSFYSKYPNDFIAWEVFLWAKKNGYLTFDWGGAGKPGVPYGVRDYKAQFGGTFVNFGRFEKIHNKTLFGIAKAGFKIWQQIKS